MKNRVFSIRIPLLAAFLAVFPGCSRKEASPAVRIAAPAVLSAQGGFLPAVKEAFEKESGCALEIEAVDGASGLVSLLSSAGGAARIDAVMGIDEMVFERVRSRLEEGAFPEPGLSLKVLPVLAGRLKPGFVPLVYQALSFVYRKGAFKNTAVPGKLADLLKPALKKKFILQDPRSSVQGMMFFLFAKSLPVRALRAQWAALAPGWDAGYKRFLEGEAPLVWSPLSALAYHASKGQEGDYGFVDFEEGLPLQIEGMARVRRSGPRKPCVDSWLGFLLKPAVLADLAARQWMLPAWQEVRVPPFFDRIPPPERRQKQT